MDAYCGDTGQVVRFRVRRRCLVKLLRWAVDGGREGVHFLGRRSFFSLVLNHSGSVGNIFHCLFVAWDPEERKLGECVFAFCLPNPSMPREMVSAFLL